VIEEMVRIPDWIKDHDSFRRWARSAAFPDRGWFSFLKGEVWIDMSPEELFTHNQVKGEYALVLGGLVKSARLGRYYPDRMLLSHPGAGLTTEPDGMFISHETRRSGRVAFKKGVEGYIEIEGTPDMVLEVVSRSSQRKDTKMLYRSYWEAGISEYWLVDVRGGQLRFDIYRHTAKGYVAVRPQAGWRKSRVFGKSFRLTVQPDENGDPEYTLALR
jgi:Uma2 family endonuclease